MYHSSFGQIHLEGTWWAKGGGVRGEAAAHEWYPLWKEGLVSQRPKVIVVFLEIYRVNSLFIYLNNI